MLFYSWLFSHLYHMPVRRDEIFIVSRTISLGGRYCNFRVQEIEGNW